MAFTLLDIERIISGIRRRLRVLEIQGNGAVIKTGLAVSRPSAPTLTPGTTITYYATDTKVLSIWNVVNESWDTVTFS